MNAPDNSQSNSANNGADDNAPDAYAVNAASPDSYTKGDGSESGLGLATDLQHHKIANCNNLQQNQPVKTEMARRAAKQHKKWNKRLKILFCCLGYKKNKDSIADVASIFAEFYADLKVPSSDIAAGFVLLSKYQAAQRKWIVEHNQEHFGVEQYLSGIPIRMNTKFLDLSTAEDSHLVNDLIYYLNYSLAIFGWPMHLVDDPCLLCCIYPYLKLSPCCSSASKQNQPQRPKSCAKKKETSALNANKKQQDVASKMDDETQRLDCRAGGDDAATIRQRTCAPKVGELDEGCDMPIILEDNCCSCNVASAERRLASHNYEIIYVNYKVNINVVPFLVAADHSKQAIVVAIRGSMSLSDMVTDMNGQVDKVPLSNCPDDWLCHRGITRAALYVKMTLEQERIIERALSCRPDLGSQNYKLVLCGHSLGAGAAAILGVLMRSQYPTLKAYLYSPPGGILSMPVVEYTKEFATGVILGNDTVPRLGVAQLERLRYHTLLSIKSTQKSTSKILAKALCPTCCFGDNEVEYDPTQSLDLLHGTEGRAFEYSGTTIPLQSQPEVLYVPGRLIHVVKNYSFRSKKTSQTTRLWSGPIYQAVWTDNSMYDRVIISEGMFFDHLPNKLMQAMKMLFSKTLPGRSESRSSTSVAISTEQQQQRQVSPPTSNLGSSRDISSFAESICRSEAKTKVLQVENEIQSDIEDDNNNNGKAFPNLNNLHHQGMTQQVNQKLTEIVNKHESNIKTHDEAVPINSAKSNLDENGNEQC